MDNACRRLRHLITCALSLALLLTACSNVKLGTVADGSATSGDGPLDLGNAPDGGSSPDEGDTSVMIDPPAACQVPADCRLIRDPCNGCQTCRALGKAQPDPTMCGNACPVSTCADYIVDCIAGKCFGGIPGPPRQPKVHRSSAAECDHSRAPGNADPSLTGGECVNDAQCTQQPNGRCLLATSGARINHCSYDSCFLDTACSGTTPVCRCRQNPTDPNTCVPGSCKVDSDCGGFCSPSVSFANTYFFDGYRCHTKGDACFDDSDCGVAGSHAACAFDPTASHWACSTAYLPPP
jgi:hypothetical protein